MQEWKDLKAGDVMTAPVTGIDVDTSLGEAAKLLSESQISGAIVTDREGAAVGVVSLFDIVSALAGLERVSGQPGGFYSHAYPRFEQERAELNGEEEWEEAEPDPLRDTTVGEIMATEIIGVSIELSLMEVAKLLWNRHIHRVFVLQDGRPVGVISTMDLLGALAGASRVRVRA